MINRDTGDILPCLYFITRFPTPVFCIPAGRLCRRAARMYRRAAQPQRRAAGTKKEIDYDIKNGRIYPKRHIRPLYQINVRNASETFHYFAYIASCNFHDIISLWKHIGRKFHFISGTYTASIKSAYKHSACRENLYTYIVVALQKEK